MEVEVEVPGYDPEKKCEENCAVLNSDLPDETLTKLKMCSNRKLSVLQYCLPTEWEEWIENVGVNDRDEIDFSNSSGGNGPQEEKNQSTQESQDCGSTITFLGLLGLISNELI